MHQFILPSYRTPVLHTHANKTLEETCERLKSDESISVMRRDSASAVYVPMRIRELVHEYLSPQVGSFRK